MFSSWRAARQRRRLGIGAHAAAVTRGQMGEEGLTRAERVALRQTTHWGEWPDRRSPARDAAAARGETAQEVEVPLDPVTIPEFLSARVDEDEARIIAARWAAPTYLADCAAKRLIIKLHALQAGFVEGEWSCAICGWVCSEDGSENGRAGVMGCETLRALTLRYVDHRSYRKEWALEVEVRT